MLFVAITINFRFTIIPNNYYSRIIKLIYRSDFNFIKLNYSTRIKFFNPSPILEKEINVEKDRRGKIPFILSSYTAIEQLKFALDETKQE